MTKSPTGSLLLTLEELQTQTFKMNLFQDLFAKAVFLDKYSCEHVLRILTGNKSLIVKENFTQHLISKLTAHDIIMDVLVEDSNHKLYEIEIQKAKGNIAHEKRMLYYASSIISDYFFKGDQTYASVPELHIFYISQTDIWNKRKTCYPVLKHLGDLKTPYDDGLHMCYINAEIDDQSEIARLMQFFKTANANDGSQGALSKRINTIKTTEEGIAIMDDFSKKLYDAGMNDGRAEGETSEKYATARRMLAKGKYSLQDIAELTNLTIATIEKLQAEG